MRCQLLALGLVTTLAATNGLGFESGGANDATAEITRLEAERFLAMQSGDVAALERILAPELTYTHSTARVDSKTDFIEAIKSGRLKYRSIVLEETRVRDYDTTAVVVGQGVFVVEDSGRDLRVHLRFLDVYVKRDGAWQLVAWQSTRVPEP